MKHIIFLVIILTSIKSNSQTFQNNFLGKDFQLYKGVLLKINEEPAASFDHTFYSDIKYCQSPLNSNVIYPDTRHNYRTVKDSLKNKVFIVYDIIDKTGQRWNENSKNDSFSKPIFVLKDTISAQYIYYKYDEEYEFNFPFNTSKINYPTDYFCSKIEKTIDDFTDEIKFSSPSINGYKDSSVKIYRFLDKIKNTYYLKLRTYGSTLNINEKGVIILFDDGTKWSRASEISVDTDSNRYVYSAFITLSTADLLIFSTKKIKKFRLYIYDEEVDKNYAEKFKQYVNCIRNVKK